MTMGSELMGFYSVGIAWRMSITAGRAGGEILRCQGLTDGLCDQFAAALPGCAGLQDLQDFEAYGLAPHQKATAWQHFAGAVNGGCDDAHLRAFGRRECATQKSADLGSPVECTLRKEHQGLPGGGQLPYAAGIGGAFVAVEAFDERGSEAPQQ